MLNAPLTQWWKLVEHAATAATLHFLRQPIRPIAPRPVVKRSSDAGSGVAKTSELIDHVPASFHQRKTPGTLPEFFCIRNYIDQAASAAGIPAFSNAD
jgi:hypothetical protein